MNIIDKTYKNINVNYDFIDRFEKDYTMITKALFERGRHLTTSAKWLYATLADFKNQKTGLICPSYEAIIERSGLCKGTIASAIQELEEFCWLKYKKNYSGNNRYTLLIPPDAVFDEEDEVLEIIYEMPTNEQAEVWSKSKKEKLEKRKIGKTKVELQKSKS